MTTPNILIKPVETSMTAGFFYFLDQTESMKRNFGQIVEWLNSSTFWGLDRTYKELKLVAHANGERRNERRLDRTYKELKLFTLLCNKNSGKSLDRTYKELKLWRAIHNERQQIVCLDRTYKELKQVVRPGVELFLRIDSLDRTYEELKLRSVAWFVGNSIVFRSYL